VNRPAVQLLVWATYLAVLTVILWIWWPHWLSVVELGGAAVITALIAILFTLAHPRGAAGDGAAPEDRRPSRDLSVGSVLIAIALCGMLYGAEFGFSLVLICAGLLVLGVVQLANELRAERQGGER
jgi:hypothetical protein